MHGLKSTGAPTQSLPESLPAPSEQRRYAWHHALKKMAESDLEMVLVKEFFGDYQIPKNESDRQQLIKLITNARNDNPLFETERAHFLSLLRKDTNELNSPPASSSSSSSTTSLPQTTSSTLLKCWAQYVKNNFAGGTDTTMLIARIVEKDLSALEQCDPLKAADLMLTAAKEIKAHQWEILETYSTNVLVPLRVSGVSKDMEPNEVIPQVVDILLDLHGVTDIDDIIKSKILDLLAALGNASATANISTNNISANISHTNSWPSNSVLYSAPMNRNVLSAAVAKNAPTNASSSSTAETKPANSVLRTRWMNYVRSQPTTISTKDMFAVSNLFNDMYSLEQCDISGIKTELFARAKNPNLDLEVVGIFSNLAKITRAAHEQDRSIDPTEMMPHLFEILLELREVKDISQISGETDKKIEELYEALQIPAPSVVSLTGTGKVSDTANRTPPALFQRAGDTNYSDIFMPSFNEFMENPDEMFPEAGIDPWLGTVNNQEDYRNKRKREEIQSPQPQKKIKLESGSATQVPTSATTSSNNTANSVESKASALKQQLLSALNTCSAYFSDESHFFLAVEIIQALELPHDMPIDGDEFKTCLLTALRQDDLYSSHKKTLVSMATSYSMSKNAFDMDIEGASLLAAFFSQFAKVMSE